MNASSIPGSSSLPADTARPLAGRHAVVTGASRGIGAAIAAELARLGADLTLLGRDENALSQQRLALAETQGGRVAVRTADVTDSAAMEDAIAGAAGEFGPPAILVNNAGAAESVPFAELTDTQWRHMLEVNLTGTFHGCRAVVPSMLEHGWGRIVNVASTAALTGYAYVAAYCAAKHGVLGLTRALALELARRNITVNAVCPGFTDTDMTEHSIRTIMERTGRDAAAARRELVRFNPQGRLVHPGEVAAAVGWLVLPSSASVTGQAIAVAGGEVMP